MPRLLDWGLVEFDAAGGGYRAVRPEAAARSLDRVWGRLRDGGAGAGANTYGGAGPGRVAQPAAARALGGGGVAALAVSSRGAAQPPRGSARAPRRPPVPRVGRVGPRVAAPALPGRSSAAMT
jgi:hypothetical protein